MEFKTWLEAEGYRGIGPGEMRTLAKSGDRGYDSPTMKSRSVYFDTGPEAKDTALKYIHQGGGGDLKLGAKSQSAGRGYVLKVDAPEAEYPDFATDAGPASRVSDSSYRVVPRLKPSHVATVQSVRPGGEINFGGMSIAKPPVLGKERPAGKFIDTYQRMFGAKSASQSP